LAAAFWLPADAAGDTARGVLFVYGLMAMVFGGLSALFRHREAQAKAALARGEEVLARWVVDTEAWREFAAGAHQFNEAEGVPNEFLIPDTIPAAGLEVIVGKGAIQIGDSIHVLPRRGTPEVTHANVFGAASGGIYCELRLYYPGGGQGASGIPRGPRRSMLRFPVVPGALREAEAAIAHYRAGRPGKADFFHGRGDGTDAEDVSECIACGFKTHAFVSHCPQCGAGVQSRRWSRRFGFLLTLCGLFISGAMGAVLYYALPLLLHPGESVGGSSFSGTPAQALMVLGVLCLVMGFGLACLGYGIWQIVTGRRSARVIGVILAMWTLFLLIAWLLE
jgi:hypothetical protein